MSRILSDECVPAQLSNSSLHDYMEKHIFAPLNLSNAFYWTGGQGMQPGGLHSGVVPMPGYYTTFKGEHACLAPKAMPEEPESLLASHLQMLCQNSHLWCKHIMLGGGGFQYHPHIKGRASNHP